MHQTRSRFGAPEVTQAHRAVDLQRDRTADAAGPASFPDSRENTCQSSVQSLNQSTCELTTEEKPMQQVLMQPTTQSVNHSTCDLTAALQCPDSPSNASPRKFIASHESVRKVGSQTHAVPLPTTVVVVDSSARRRVKSLTTGIAAVALLMCIVGVSAHIANVSDREIMVGKYDRERNMIINVHSGEPATVASLAKYTEWRLDEFPYLDDEKLSERFKVHPTFAIRLSEKGKLVMRTIDGVDVPSSTGYGPRQVTLYTTKGDTLVIEPSGDMSLTSADGTKSFVSTRAGARRGQPLLQDRFSALGWGAELKR